MIGEPVKEFIPMQANKPAPQSVAVLTDPTALIAAVTRLTNAVQVLTKQIGGDNAPVPVEVVAELPVEVLIAQSTAGKCAVHGTSLEKLADGMCPGCMKALILRGPQNWPLPWQGWKVTRLVHRHLLDEAVKNLTDKPPIEKEGRGIVIGAGGTLYFRCAWVCAYVLRRLGCKLPIQFWYLGPPEMDPTMIAVAESAGIECIDAYEVDRQIGELTGKRARRLNPWENKPFSVAHCRFREVIYLDADNIAMLDPTFLFENVEYKQTGAMWWPDLPPSIWKNEWIPHAVLEAAGLPIDQKYRPFESGQYLVNTVRCWREISLTCWFNDHSDYWFGKVDGPAALYGDKDTGLLAWHKLDTPYAMPNRDPGWNHPAILQYAPDGALLFNHACQGKDSIAKGQRIASLPNGATAVEAIKDLNQRWHGEIWAWRDQSKEETELAKTLVGTSWNYRRIGHDERIIQLGDRGKITSGAAGNESRWTLRIIHGAPELIIGNDNHAIMFLVPKSPEDLPNQTFTGAWTRHERMPVELVPGYRGALPIQILESRQSLEHFCKAAACSLKTADGPYLCRILGKYSIYVLSTDVQHAECLVREGSWEPWVTLALARTIKPGWTILDVGSSYGYFSTLAAVAVGPKGHVIAVDPNPATNTLLRQTLVANDLQKRAIVITAVVGSDSLADRVLVHVPKTDPGTASIYPHLVEGRDLETIEAPTKTVDEITKNLQRVNLVKLDIEGAEAMALRSMTETWERSPGMIVVLEFRPGFHDNPEELLKYYRTHAPLKFIDEDGEVRDFSVEKMNTKDPDYTWSLWLQR